MYAYQKIHNYYKSSMLANIMMPITAVIEIYKISRQWFSFSSIVVLMGMIGITLLVKKRKKIYGFAIITGRYLHYMAVSKEHHGKGYGRKLLKKVIPRVDRLRVAAYNKKAIKIYKKYGFKIVRKENTLNGMKYLMIKGQQ
jgi:GNAT superfamily N-acetyltransferase